MTSCNNNTQQEATKELEQFGYQQQLKRSLGVWQLTAFGLNYMIPIAPALIFGFILVSSGGTVALPYLLAMIAMLFTANSYSLMIQAFPFAGSLYSYVSRGWSARIGFIAGWVLLLDYILIPTVTAAGAATYIHAFFPLIPYPVWLFIFAVLTGLVNLFGVELMATVGLWMLLIGEVVIFTGFWVWGHYVVEQHGIQALWSQTPFHFSSIHAVSTATAMAVLSYLGFDAITTLSEEANNPHKDIPRAIFIRVIIGGATMFITGYLGVLAIGHWQQYAHDTTWQAAALFHLAEHTGGKAFSVFYASGFIIAMAVFNVVASAAGSRLLFGMGRDGVLPRSIFAAINQRFNTPHWNIIIIVVLEYCIGSALSIDHISELVNFGAIIGFLLLNITIIIFFYRNQTSINLNHPPSTPHWRKLLCPLLGALIMIWLITGMPVLMLTTGCCWLALGIIASYAPNSILR